MATIKQRGNGYQVSFISKCGRRYRVQFDDVEAAKLWLAEAQVRDLRDEPIRADVATRAGMAFEELRALTHAKYWKGTRGERTAEINAGDVVSIIGPLLPVKSVTTHHVDHLISTLEQRGNSNGTINRKLAALSKMLRYARERDIIPPTQVIRMDRKREAMNRVRYLTPEEESGLVKWFNYFGKPLMADLCVFLVDTGLRLGEALRLEWKDVDADLIHVWQTKTDNPRSVPLSNRAKEIINRLRPVGGNGPFTSITKSSVTHAWNMVRAKMGLSHDDQFVPHALRHTCASRLVQQGVELVVVKEWLGHKTIQMTLRYAHLSPKNLFRAVEALNAIHVLPSPKDNSAVA